MLRIPNEIIFFILRLLKKANPGDTYYENYLGHYARNKDEFFDIYHFSWAWAIEHKPKRILEIGTRTGTSLCQLLSAYMDPTTIERIVSCDLFDDGFISPELVKYNLSYINIPESVVNRIEFMVGDSRKIVPTIQGDFDYILVDGEHSPSGMKADLDNVKNLCPAGGVIVVDDICPDIVYPGVFDGGHLLKVWEVFSEENKDRFDSFTNLKGKGTGWAVRK